MLETREAKTKKKREVVPLSALSSPISPTEVEKDGCET